MRQHHSSVSVIRGGRTSCCTSTVTAANKALGPSTTRTALLTPHNTHPRAHERTQLKFKQAQRNRTEQNSTAKQSARQRRPTDHVFPFQLVSTKHHVQVDRGYLQRSTRGQTVTAES